MTSSVLKTSPTVVPSDMAEERRECAKCGKQADIVCFVDGFPWCEQCLINALQKEGDYA